MNMLKSLILAFAAAVLTGHSVAGDFNSTQIMTEQYPPFNYQEKGELKGISVDLLHKVFEEMGTPIASDRIKLLPWAKGYKSIMNDPNTMLFVMTHTEERKPLFKWVGPVAPSRVTLIARKADAIKINSIEDVKNYKVGAIREDIGEQLLLKEGVSRKAIDSSSSIQANIKKLNKGRIQLWAYAEPVAMYAIKEAGYDSADYESVYTLSESELYYALHQDFDEAMVAKFQAALDAVKASGEYDNIISKYR